MQVQLLRYLIRVGEAAAKVRPELAIRFELPSLSTAPKHFLSSVRAMLSQAETEREFLLSVGLSELALTDLAGSGGNRGGHRGEPYRPPRTLPDSSLHLGAVVAFAVP